MNRTLLSALIILGLTAMTGAFLLIVDTPASAAVNTAVISLDDSKPASRAQARHGQAQQGAAPTPTPTDAPLPTATPEIGMPPPTPIPTCPPSLLNPPTPLPGVTPSPTPLPDFSGNATSCINVPQDEPDAAASGTPDYIGPPGPGSGIGELARRWEEEESASASIPANSSSKFSFANHELKCSTHSNTSCPNNPTGIEEIAGNVSARAPKLPQGKSWRDYHYFNRIHVVNRGGRNIICPNASGINYRGPEHISVGFAKGLFGTKIYHNELIVEKYYRDVTDYGRVKCEIVGTGRIHNDPSAIFYKIYRSGNVWQAQAWFGDWLDLTTAHTTWTVASSVVYGQEIWAKNGDKQNVLAPLNFIHHVNIKGSNNDVGPWHEAYLKSPLKGRSGTRTDAPFSVTDLAGDDRTSISSCVPVNNLCE